MEAKLFPPKANGNRLTRLVLCGTLALTGTAALHAQYSMDLSRINLPDTTYLTLGHPGPTGKEGQVADTGKWPFGAIKSARHKQASCRPRTSC